MKLEIMTITLMRNNRPRVDPKHNLTKIKDFAAALPLESAWMEQALRSLITEDSHGLYGPLKRSAISNISLGSEGVTIAFKDSVLEERSHEITLETLKDYTYEANGLVKPSQNDPIASKYPKWDLIKQSLEQEKSDGVITNKNKRIGLEYAWGMGPISKILIKGKQQAITLESVTLDEVPLNAVETKMLEYANKIKNYREEISKRTNKIFQATVKKDREGRYILGGDDTLWNKFLSYTTPKGRRNRKLKEIKNEEEQLKIPKEERYEIGINTLDNLSPNQLSLLHIELALTDEIFHAKRKASFVHYFHTELIDELFEKVDKYIIKLDVGIKQYLPKNKT